MIYYSSDSHFGHDKLIEWINRPFKDGAEMNYEMIRRWIKKVP